MQQSNNIVKKVFQRAFPYLTKVESTDSVDYIFRPDNYINPFNL